MTSIAAAAQKGIAQRRQPPGRRKMRIGACLFKSRARAALLAPRRHGKITPADVDVATCD